MCNNRELFTTKYVSADSIWKMSDIVNIVKMWEHESNVIAKIQEYTLVVSTWNHRSQQVERDYGGIVIFIES